MQVGLSTLIRRFTPLVLWELGNFWLNMAAKEIKVHRRIRCIRMEFPMIQRAKNDRSVQKALPVYDIDRICIREYNWINKKKVLLYQTTHM